MNNATATRAVTTVPRRERVRAYVALSGVVLFWGLNFPVAKGALAVLPPTAFNAIRFPLASLFIYVVMRAQGNVHLPTGADRRRIIWLGLLGNVLYQNLFIFGLAHTRAGSASVLLSGSPIVTALLSARLGHERVKLRAWLGIFIAFAGIAFVVFAGGAAGAAHDGGGTDSPTGDVLLLAATVSWAFYTVGSKGVVSRHGPVAVTAIALWAGSIGLFIVGLPALLRVDPSVFTPRIIFALLYSGVFSLGLAYICWYYGVRVIGNTRASAFSNISPVIALLAAWPLLGEAPRLWQFAGAAIIIFGVTLTQTSNVEQKEISATASG